MKALLLILCIALSVTSIGCLRVLDDWRRDDGHISHMGASAKARQIEEDLNWGTSF